MSTSQKSPKRTRTPLNDHVDPHKKIHISSHGKSNHHSNSNGLDKRSTVNGRQEDKGHVTNSPSPMSQKISDGFVAGYHAGSRQNSPKNGLPNGITLTDGVIPGSADSSAKKSSPIDRSSFRTPSPSGRSIHRDSGTPPLDGVLIDEILSFTSYYDVLGVAKDCPVEEIRRAYLRRSRTVHPDRQGSNNPKATEAFQRLAAAYETLKDPKKRKMYDVQGEKGNYTGSGEETFSAAMSQLLEEFLSGNFDQILTVVELLRRSNPELNISQEAVHDFLVSLREYVMVGSNIWDACRSEVFKLMELQTSSRDLSYLDVPGRLKIAIQLSRTILQIPLRMNQTMNPQNNSKLGSGMKTLCIALDGAMEKGERLMDTDPWSLLEQSRTMVRGSMTRVKNRLNRVGSGLNLLGAVQAVYASSAVSFGLDNVNLADDDF